MPRNKNIDLQNHLFETLEKLKDGDIDAEKAKAVCDVSKQILEAKKLEHDGNALKLKAVELIAEYTGDANGAKMLLNEHSTTPALPE